MSPEEPSSLESENKLTDVIEVGRWVERLATGLKLTDSAVQEQLVDNERLVCVLRSKSQKLREEGVEFAADELDTIVANYFGARSVGYIPIVVVNDISDHSNRALGHSSQEETMNSSIIEHDGNQVVKTDRAQSDVQKNLGV